MQTNLFYCTVQAEKVYNQDLYFKKTVKFVGEPMSHMESIASSAVHFSPTLFYSLAQRDYILIEVYIL